MLQGLKRVIKNGLVSFKRNQLLTISSVGIMVLTLSVMLSLVLVNYSGKKTIQFLEDKINFSIYFKPEVPEVEIKNIQKEMGSLSQVKNVDYISQEEALENFRQRHPSDATFSEALGALGQNPFAASLNIKVQQTKDFESIYNYVENAAFRNLIEKITYYENQQIIRRVNLMINSLEQGGIILGALLIFLAFLVTYNTIRIAIYSQREEISVMRLVGASNWFIRGPFVITGILYGLIAAALVSLIFLPLIYWVSPYLQTLVGSFNLKDYFFSQAEILFLILLGVGISIGSLSSIFALNRYLKI